MITQLKGRLVEKSPTDVVIDCNGVGYLVNISLNTFSKLTDSERSLISETMSIEGTINSSGAIDVAGLVKGPVFSKEIIIRDTGSITGTIEADHVEIHGHLDGKVSGENIIIGASIRYGKHNKNLYKFISSNKETLEKKRSAFFSVNVVARKPEKNTPETNPYVQKFLKISNWKPDRLGVFAGKVDYPKYGFFDKHIIQLIMLITKGPTDLSLIHISEPTRPERIGGWGVGG